MTSGPEVPAHGKANMTEEDWERYEVEILNLRAKRWANRDQSITSVGYRMLQRSQQSKARR
jgi:hypothetical protein